MFRNMVTSLLEHERIYTTHAKAKELRRWADWMITLGKRGDLHARRQALQVIRDKGVVHKLFTDLAQRYQARSGGYTRTVKVGFRVGDGAPLSLIELMTGETVKKKKKRKRKPRKAVEAAPPAVEEAVEEKAVAAEVSADEPEEAVAEEAVEKKEKKKRKPAKKVEAEAPAAEEAVAEEAVEKKEKKKRKPAKKAETEAPAAEEVSEPESEKAAKTAKKNKGKTKKGKEGDEK
jgi:large subunit ribosomal protein L17